MNTQAFEAAIQEAELGCPIFPVRAPVISEDGVACSCSKGAACPVPGKHPHITGWPGMATTDRAQIDRWAKSFPGCNWGGVTGKKAGRIIIEIDPRAGGEDGLAELEQILGPLPETRTYRSGSGGMHYVFVYPIELDYVINAAGNVGPHAALGVDVRGDGGYGVLPGSLHKSGNRYELYEDLPIAELPPKWREALAAEPPSEADPDAEPYEGPRAEIAPIMAECAFMAHARDDAATLGEEDWWIATTIAACTEDGIENVHRLSEAYPTYSREETDQKAKRARSQDKPFSCAGIAKRTGGKWCEGCTHRDRIKSPIVLGLPRLESKRPGDAGDANDGDADIDDGEDGSRRKSSQATRLIDLAIAAGAEFFHDLNNQPFVSIVVNGHRENWGVRSSGFRTYLQRCYYETHHAAAGSSAVQDALSTLEGMAIFDGEERAVSVRTATGEDGAIYLDLGDKDWRAVKVTSEGWGIVNQCPAAFQRSRTIRELPYPEVGGKITDLGSFLNLAGGATGNDFLLVVAYMVAALLPTGPYPILDLIGEQGGGKTTTTRLIRRLVDPRQVEVTSISKDDGDLATVAANTHLLTFDNASHISDENADKLCRLSTGGGFHKRKLYTDDDEHAVDCVRPTILNGIPDLATRPDLADRTIAIELPPLRGKNRQPESLFWQAFDQAAPKLFGALLDALVIALRGLPSIQRDDLPRMADFARLGESMLPIFKRKPGEFIRAMRANAERQNAVILEAYPDMAEVLVWSATWEGERTVTARTLLDLLNENASAETKKSRVWPKSAKDLSTNLRRAAPNLYAAGLSVTFTRDGKGRYITFAHVRPETIREDASSASQASQDAATDDASDANDAEPPIVSKFPTEGTQRATFAGEPPDDRTCSDCGGPLEPHRRYRCDACIAKEIARVEGRAA